MPKNTIPGMINARAKGADGVKDYFYICHMNFSEEFPVLANCTYLNTANSGILSQSLINWRRLHDEDFMQTGSQFRLTQADFLESVRQQLARFFKGNPHNTFLVPNFSFGFNAFLDGLSKSHRFLLITSDYPSVNYPVESRGFTCGYAEQNEHLEENILEEIKTFKPTILALSLVQYTNGIKIDFDFIKRLKADFPGLLIIADGTQYCGTENFNFEASGLDALISSCYKWILGGYGNGFVMIKDHVSEYLYQERMPHHLPKEPFLKGKTLLSLCFEPGHLDTLNFGTLQQSMLFLEGLGFEYIERSIKSISDAAKNAFTERGLLSGDVVRRGQHSSIFNIRSDAKLTKKLQDANIIAVPRGKGIRVSFHFYNTEQDLEKLLQVIDHHQF
jgi:selenocysteine lyase/cysteine desulfurase